MTESGFLEAPLVRQADGELIENNNKHLTFDGNSTFDDLSK